MSENWDDYAEGWDSNDAVVAYSEKAYESLLNTVNIDGTRVLDFGCGTGLLTEKIAQRAESVVAVDASTKMIALLDQKQIKNLRTIANTLTPSLIAEHELFQAKFDLVVASSALAFVPDYEETLHLLKQVLKTNGYLIQWDWLQLEEGVGVGFTKERLDLAFEQVGFQEWQISLPFSMKNEEDSMSVVMSVAQNS